jgi:AraC-like DNA-binding protein
MMSEDIFPNLEYLIYRETYKNWSIPERKIDNHELVLITEGTGFITIEGKKIEVNKDTLIYFYPNQKHSLFVKNEPYMKFYGVHFIFKNNMQKLQLPDITTLKNSKKLKKLFDELHHTYTEKLYLYSWRQNIILQEIFFDIFYNIQCYNSPINENRIDKVLTYIHSNPYKQYTIAELTNLAGIKKSLFIKIFKEITDYTPIEYTTKLKLDHSKNFLVNSPMSISDIAFQCGFNDPFYFSRLFKNNFGISPKGFKEQTDSII